MENLQQIKAKLEACGQEQLLRFYDRLTPPEQEKLIRDIQEIDFDAMPDLNKRAKASQEHVYQPIEVCDLEDIEQLSAVVHRMLLGIDSGFSFNRYDI